VKLGVDQPVWKKLYEELSSLAATSGGAFAFVLDEGNGLWCVGVPNREPMSQTFEENRAADRFYAAEVASLADSLRRGGRIDVAKVDGDDRYVALSFATIYVLVVWFKGDFEVPLVRARMRRVLPNIEALVIDLPPDGGAGGGTGGGKRLA
jgi:hypothetical protein